VTLLCNILTLTTLATSRSRPLRCALAVCRLSAKLPKGCRAPRITKLDVWPLVVQGGLKNEPEHPTAHLRLIAHAKKHCSREMLAFLFKIRARLPALIDDIWQWEHVDAALADAERSRIDRRHALSGDIPMCVRWRLGGCGRLFAPCESHPIGALCAEFSLPSAQAAGRPHPLWSCHGPAAARGSPCCSRG
jgi:hypothetical protein